MGVVSPADANFSPFGIKYAGTNVNLQLRNNRIRNRTVSNPNYVASGSQTGTKRISKDT